VRRRLPHFVISRVKPELQSKDLPLDQRDQRDAEANPDIPAGEPARSFWRRALDTFCDRVENFPFTPLHTGLALLALAAFYICLTAVGSARQFWHDELFTYYIAKAPTMALFWHELHFDLNPPLVYLAVRASLRLFGDSEYAARLPSILGFGICSLCLFLFVARRLQPRYGFVALLVFWSTPVLYYATEARPYGLLLGFFGLAMLAWQSAIRAGRSALSVVALAAAVFAMMTTHFFALFYIGPFCLAELIRQFRNRKFDWAVWAALLLPTIFLFIYIPVMTSYQAGAFPPTFQGGLKHVPLFYKHALTDESPLLLVALCIAVLAGRRRSIAGERRSEAMTPVEMGFAAGLLLLPLVLNIVLMRSHSAFFDRYAYPALLGLGILLAFFLAFVTRASRLAAAILSLSLFGYLAAAEAALPLLSAWRAHGRPAAASPLLAIEPDLPLVANSGLVFLEMDRYADPRTVARLHYLSDRDLAIRYAHATIFEGFGNLKKFFPIRAAVDPYAQFVSEHPRFLVLGTPDFPEDWLLRRLLDIHAAVRYIGDIPGPYRDSALYEVTMPNP
jgi:hypothetical protein